MISNQEHSLLAPLPTTAFDVVVIAASLGGMQALTSVLSALPADFPAAIIVVQHLSPMHSSELAPLLNRRTALNVKWAEQGDRVSPGNVYVAPPNYHVLVSRHHILSLSQSPPVQYVRPSANPLFQTVASTYRERAIGIVLTGKGSDGAQGAWAIKQQGGVVLAQDKATSESFSMPEAAIKMESVDFTLPLHIIARALISLVMVRGAAMLFRVPLISTKSHPRDVLSSGSRRLWEPKTLGAEDSGSRRLWEPKTPHAPLIEDEP